MYCLSWTVSNPLWPLWAANSFFAIDSDAPPSHRSWGPPPHPRGSPSHTLPWLRCPTLAPLTPCAPHLQSTSHLFVWLFSRPFTHLAQFFRMVILIMRQFQAMVEIWAQSDWCNGFSNSKFISGHDQIFAWAPLANNLVWIANILSFEWKPQIFAQIYLRLPDHLAQGATNTSISSATSDLWSRYF